VSHEQEKGMVLKKFVLTDFDHQLLPSTPGKARTSAKRQKLLWLRIVKHYSSSVTNDTNYVAIIQLSGMGTVDELEYNTSSYPTHVPF
jgi:hypothetical protein